MTDVRNDALEKLVNAMLGNVFKLICVGFLLAGCTSVAPVQKVALTAEQKVMARVQARWDILLTKDLDKAYEFLSPATRVTLSKDVYKLRINPAYWRGATAKSATCKEEVCDVKVELKIMVLAKLPVDQMIEEKWILDQGQWWFVHPG